MTSSTGAGAVLSDATIQEQLAVLIDTGTATNAKEAGYEFLPGKLYPTGDEHQGKPIDWTDPACIKPETSYAVDRGELILVRTKERVRMPKNMCGLWSPLDRNSRQGLLLVNMSVVPPGYDGFLTCTFVNFGNRSLLLKPTQPIARILFFRLDREAIKTGVTVESGDYDRRMSELARDAPSTFLAINERTAELENIVSTANSGFKASTDRLVSDAKDELAKAVRVANDSMQKDAKGLFASAWPWALLAIGLLTAAQTAGNWVSANFLSDNIDRLAKQRADQIEAKINDQLKSVGGKPVFVYEGTPEAKAMAEKLAAIERQLKELASQPAAGQKTTPR